MCFVCHHINNSFLTWYKSQVKSDILRNSILRITVNCRTVNHRMFVMWPRNIHALSSNVCAVCASVYRLHTPTKRLTCEVANHSTKKTIVSQVANRSCREEEFQKFPRRYSLEFVTLDQQILLAIPRTLHEVSAGASWITMLCHTQIRELPI